MKNDFDTIANNSAVYVDNIHKVALLQMADRMIKIYLLFLLVLNRTEYRNCVLSQHQS